MLRVMIADDHTVVRRGLIQIIKENFSESTIQEAADYPGVFAALTANTFDILILDLFMPEGNGIDAIKVIKSRYEQMPVLVLSMYPEDQFALRTLKAGASCYLNKESMPEELVFAMKELLQGRKYVTPKTAESLIWELENPFKSPHQMLSDREFEVFQMLVAGKKLSEISVTLSISIKTAGTYKSRIFTKLRVNSVAELIRYADNNNLEIPS